MIVSNFLFHRVSPERDPLWDPLAPKSLEKILRYLLRRFRVVSLEELFLSPHEQNPEEPVCTIGFDDGYRDNIEHALPLLQKYGCPASFYVVTDCIDDKLPTWTHQLDYVLRNTRATSVRLETPALPVELLAEDLRSDAAKLDYARRLKPCLKVLGNTDRVGVVEQLKERLDDVEIPRNLMMSWNDVCSLHSAGFTVGSHTKTHSMLASIESRDELRQELEHSRDRIIQEIGAPPIAISYPIGSVNNAVVDESKRTGYRLGLATGQRVYDTAAHSDLFRIPRIELYNESWWKTRMRISGHLEMLKKWIRH